MRPEDSGGLPAFKKDSNSIPCRVQSISLPIFFLIFVFLSFAILSNSTPLVINSTSSAPPKNNLIDLKVGDKIVRVNDDDPLENEGELIHALRGKSENFSLEIFRNGSSKVISGKLETYDLVTDRKGIFVSGMLISNRAMWRDDPVITRPKFDIQFVQAGSPAEDSMIDNDEYLESLNGKVFESLDDLYTFFKEHEGKEAKFKLSSVTRGADKSYYFTHYEHTLLVSDLEFIGGALGEDKKGK